jgi:hypothetical protein
VTVEGDDASRYVVAGRPDPTDDAKMGSARDLVDAKACLVARGGLWFEGAHLPCAFLCRRLARHLIEL